MAFTPFRDEIVIITFPAGYNRGYSNKPPFGVFMIRKSEGL